MEGKYLGYPELIKNIGYRMKRLLKLAKLNQSLTPHSLRHTHTSLLAEAGVGLDEIMERLGHRDDKITRNVYLHITKSRKKKRPPKSSANLWTASYNLPNVVKMWSRFYAASLKFLFLQDRKLHRRHIAHSILYCNIYNANLQKCGIMGIGVYSYCNILHVKL